MDNPSVNQSGNFDYKIGLDMGGEDYDEDGIRGSS